MPGRGAAAEAEAGVGLRPAVAPPGAGLPASPSRGSGCCTCSPGQPQDGQGHSFVVHGGPEQAVNAKVRLGDVLALACCRLLFPSVGQGSSGA